MGPRHEIDALEARVLGVLIEKQFTTPDQYPLSINALAAGCNQKSNRNPHMSLSEGEVRVVIDGLRGKALVGASHPSGGRVERYHHTAREAWIMDPAGLALMAELLLRGPQTVGELRTRAGRMHAFESLGATESEVARLVQSGFCAKLAPGPGSRAPRYTQVLVPGSLEAADASPSSTDTPAATPDPVAPAQQAVPPQPAAVPAVDARLAALEGEVATLRRQLSELAAKLGETLSSS